MSIWGLIQGCGTVTKARFGGPEFVQQGRVMPHPADCFCPDCTRYIAPEDIEASIGRIMIDRPINLAEYEEIKKAWAAYEGPRTGIFQVGTDGVIRPLEAGEDSFAERTPIWGKSEGAAPPGVSALTPAKARYGL